MATSKGPGRKEVVTEWERWGNISTKSSLQIMQYESDMNSARHHDQPFSAGILDVDHQQTVNELRSELADEKSEHAATRAYYVRWMMPTAGKPKSWPK